MTVGAEALEPASPERIDAAGGSSIGSFKAVIDTDLGLPRTDAHIYRCTIGGGESAPAKIHIIDLRPRRPILRESKLSPEADSPAGANVGGAKAIRNRRYRSWKSRSAHLLRKAKVYSVVRSEIASCSKLFPGEGNSSL